MALDIQSVAGGMWRFFANTIAGKFCTAAAALFVALLISTSVFFTVAATDAATKPRINTIGLAGVAIKGYDPVAYFTKGAPTKGSKQFALQHAGAEWRFSSAANKALFAASPEKYIPAYGGYCAYGVAQGYLVKIEPDAWSIRDGKLYLNYDAGVQRKWSASPAAYIADADKKWPSLRGK